VHDLFPTNLIIFLCWVDVVICNGPNKSDIWSVKKNSFFLHFIAVQNEPVDFDLRIRKFQCQMYLIWNILFECFGPSEHSTAGRQINARVPHKRQEAEASQIQYATKRCMRLPTIKHPNGILFLLSWCVHTVLHKPQYVYTESMTFMLICLIQICNGPLHKVWPWFWPMVG
jgi:hypothetical protein